MKKYIIGKALREAGFKHPAPTTLEPATVEVGKKLEVKRWIGRVNFYKDNPPVSTTIDLDVTYRINKVNDIEIMKVEATNER